MDMLPIAFLAAVGIGGVAYVFLYPYLSGERQAEKRKQIIARPDKAPRNSRAQQQRSRRESVESSLKELEARKKQKKLSLATRIEQAGLTWTKRQFILVSAGAGVAFMFAGFLLDANLIVVAGLGFAGGLGFPRWLLSFLKKRREQKFLNVFPDAVDVIVRGVKAGLPLVDCFKMIASEASEPVKTEFKVILDTQAIGLPLGEACAKLYERTPIPEANFFAIVISIQQKAGGNLSEALGNLSRVLRDRKKMKGKVKAMSQEAKASGAIIGSLPLCVMLLVYLTSPGYISVLFTDPFGHLLLAGSAVWMSMGILVMRNMINFDF